MAVEKEFGRDGCKYVVEGPYSHGDVNAAIVRCEGDIDARTVAAFGDAVQYVFQQGHHAVLDMAEITFMASAGYGVLISQFSSGQDQGLELMLVNIPDNMKELFDILGLNEVLTAYATIDDALKEEDPKKREIVEAVRAGF